MVCLEITQLHFTHTHTHTHTFIYMSYLLPQGDRNKICVFCISLFSCTILHTLYAQQISNPIFNNNGEADSESVIVDRILDRTSTSDKLWWNVKKKSPSPQPGTVAHTCNPSPLVGPRQVDHLSSGVQDQPGQHRETPSLLKKNTKLDGHYGGPL